MTKVGLTEALVSQLRKSKHLFVEEVKTIRKEPDSSKWDYGEIGNMINLKIEEEFVADRTKKQRDEHTTKLVEQLAGEIRRTVASRMLIPKIKVITLIKKRKFIRKQQT